MILRGNVFSKMLEMDTGLTLVTPNVLRPEGQYRVCYLLHGLYGNCNTWLDYSMLPDYASQGKTVYIMPEVARSFYTDMQHGFNYFSYVTEELPAMCKNVFNISAAREDTAVIGASMGGYGALRAALSKPEQYGMCAAFASCNLFLKEGLEHHRANCTKPEFIQRYGAKLIADFACIYGESLTWKEEYEISNLAHKATRSPQRPSLYMACGSKDPFRQDNLRMRQIFEAMDFNFTYEEWEGMHDFAFFNRALKKAIAHFGL